MPAVCNNIWTISFFSSYLFHLAWIYFHQRIIKPTILGYNLAKGRRWCFTTMYDCMCENRTIKTMSKKKNNYLASILRDRAIIHRYTWKQRAWWWSFLKSAMKIIVSLPAQTLIVIFFCGLKMNIWYNFLQAPLLSKWPNG